MLFDVQIQNLKKNLLCTRIGQAVKNLDCACWNIGVKNSSFPI